MRKQESPKAMVMDALRRAVESKPQRVQLTGGRPSMLACVAMCALLVLSTLPVMGCSGATVAQDIVNWTPALQSAASTISSIDPALLPEAVAFETLSSAVDTQAKAYLANPSATILGRLQTAIVTAQQQANASLLTAARITDSATQKHVLAAIQTYATIITTLLGLISSVSGKAAVAQMARDSTIKLVQVTPYLAQPYLDQEQPARMIATHYSVPLWIASYRVERAQQQLMQAGF